MAAVLQWQAMDVSAIAFDTHRVVKRLTDAGMDEREIAGGETSLLKWMAAALIARGGLTVVLLRLLP